MRDVVIKDFKKLSDLKQKVISAYVFSLKSELETWENMLSDDSWASDGTDYHKSCRFEAEEAVKNIKKQLKLLE